MRQRGGYISSVEPLLVGMKQNTAMRQIDKWERELGCYIFSEKCLQSIGSETGKVITNLLMVILVKTIAGYILSTTGRSARISLCRLVVMITS